MTNDYSNRKQGFELCEKLQMFLGEGFRVEYDACESGMTFFIYKGHLYKQVPNTEIKGSMNVSDYRPTTEQMIEWR